MKVMIAGMGKSGRSAYDFLTNKGYVVEFINDEIFNNYTNKLNMKIYELDASANKTIVFMNFVDIIRKIINS